MGPLAPTPHAEQHFSEEHPPLHGDTETIAVRQHYEQRISAELLLLLPTIADLLLGVLQPGSIALRVGKPSLLLQIRHKGERRIPASSPIGPWVCQS